MLLFIGFVEGGVQAQNQMPMPSYTNQYNGFVRGFWFVAPVDFKIVGLRIPSQAATGEQSFQVMRVHDPFPIAFTNQSTNFDLLLYTNGVTNGTIYATNIDISAGDTIGIIGGTQSGTANGNAYGNGSYTSTIFGYNVPIQRCGHQGYINNAAAPSVWGVGYNQAGSIGRIEVYYTHAIIQDYPYCEDFENSDGGFSEGGILPTWEHGAPNNTNISTAYSGSNAWVTDLDGDHNNDELSYAQSTLFNLSPLVDPAVRVFANYDLESGDDGVAFQVSSDSGTTWSTLGTSSSSDWYNSNSISALSSANAGNGNGWTGSSSDWVEMKHSLSAYSSDTAVAFRFQMAADGNTQNEGFGFDDLLVAESNDIKMVSMIHPDSACGTSATPVTVSLCNNSIEEKSGFTLTLDTNGTSITTTYNDTLWPCQCDTLVLTTLNTSAGGFWTLDAYVVNSGDVNTGNDTLNSTMTMYATPGVSVTGGGEYCEGDVATLTFTFQGTSPWNLSYTDSTSPFYNANLTTNPHVVNVTTGGLYEPVYVTDGSGCPADTSSISGQANVIFHPAPAVDLGPDSSVCGDYVLDAGAGQTSYSWSTGATTQSITATPQTTSYSVTVVDNNGCEGTDEVELEVFPLPTVNLPDTVVCEGASFLFNAGAPYASYLWHDGSTGQLFQLNTTGTVSVTVTDFNGCEGTATGGISAVVSNPTPSITSIASLAPVTLDAGSGYLAYLWNTNDTTQTIQVSVAGTYTCTVTDLNGCKGEDDAKTKIWPVGVEDIASQQGFAVHPNPASDFVQVTLDASRELNSYRLISIDGKLIAEGNTPAQTDRFTISLPAGTASGSYILEMSSATEVLQQRLEIVN